MKKLIEQQIEFLKKCLEDTADGSWSTHLNKPIQKQIENLTEQLRLCGVGCSLPSKDEIVAKVFTKVFRGDVDLRNVFRDEVNDAYYSGALDMHEELTK